MITDNTVLSGTPLRVLVRIAKYTTAGGPPPSLPMLDRLLARLDATAPDVFVPNKAKRMTLPAVIYNPRCAESPEAVTTTTELKVRTYVMKIVTNAAVRGRLEVVQTLCARFVLRPHKKCRLTLHALSTCVRRGYTGVVEWATASGYYCPPGRTCADIAEGRWTVLARAGADDRYDNYASIAHVFVAKPCKCGRERGPVDWLGNLRQGADMQNPASTPHQLYRWALETRDPAVRHLAHWAYLDESATYTTFDPPADSVHAACLAGRTDVVSWIYGMCRVPTAGAALIQDGFLAANARGDLTTALALADLGKVPYAAAFAAMRNAVLRNDAAAAATLIERYGILPADARMLRLLYTGN